MKKLGNCTNMHKFNIVSSERRKKGVIGRKDDVVNGIGTIRRLVDLNEWLLSRPRSERFLRLAEESRHVYEHHRHERYVCAACGYDRAVYTRHTELEGCRIICRNCEHVLIEDTGDDHE